MKRLKTNLKMRFPEPLDFGEGSPALKAAYIAAISEIVRLETHLGAARFELNMSDQPLEERVKWAIAHLDLAFGSSPST
jgi:hypothetical protein